MSLFYDTFASLIQDTCARAAIRFVSTLERQLATRTASERHSLMQYCRYLTLTLCDILFANVTSDQRLLMLELEKFFDNHLISFTKVIKSSILYHCASTRALTTCGGSRGSETNVAIYPECQRPACFHRFIYAIVKKIQRSEFIIISLRLSSMPLSYLKASLDLFLVFFSIVYPTTFQSGP